MSKVIFIALISFFFVQAGDVIKYRFPTPTGYERVAETNGSFGEFLRNLPLKKEGSNVLYFNGGVKNKSNVYAAVIDLPIGKQDLHQCADAVMRLRADYLYSIGKYDDIHFNFTNGFNCSFSKWRQGYRVAIKGNKTWWVKKASPSTSKETYWKYLEQVWMYAGTASLSSELKSKALKELQIGDVFIKGGFPGHAVIVVDKAINNNGEAAFMLAQSYMPAQELQILENPSDSKISPWYKLKEGQDLVTPEWTFSVSQLKSF